MPITRQQLLMFLLHATLKETSVPPRRPPWSLRYITQQPFALNEQRESQDTHSTWPELLLVEEAPCHHLLAEGHYISRVIQAPVLVGPELARAAPSSLNFIHQEGTAMLLGKQGREKQTCKPLGAPHPPKLEPLCSKWQSQALFPSSAEQTRTAWIRVACEHALELPRRSKIRTSNTPHTISAICGVRLLSWA